MANTLPDIRLSKTAYLNLYALSGITVGTSILIQNKSSSNVYIQQSATAPSASSVDGNIIVPNDFLLVDGGTITGCWGIGSGSITVQIYE